MPVKVCHSETRNIYTFALKIGTQIPYCKKIVIILNFQILSTYITFFEILQYEFSCKSKLDLGHAH